MEKIMYKGTLDKGEKMISLSTLMKLTDMATY
jgi:hypothetical protein